MTTTMLDRLPLDEIGEQAREVRPGHAVAAVITGVLFGLGWLVARVLGWVWLAVMWSWVAVREGWRSAQGPSRSQQIAALTAEREELLARLSRFSG